MKINPIRHLVKTNPIQTQTNPICEKPEMNVNSIMTKDYENICPCGVPKNKPNSNPISKIAIMNVTVCLKKNYENQSLLQSPENRPNQTRPGITPNLPLVAVIFALTEWIDITRQSVMAGYCRDNNGEGGIRTRGRDKPYTAFPRLLDKPLRHLSGAHRA